MKKLLVVVDMQVDFVTGSLGSDMARAIVPAVCEKVEMADEDPDTEVVYTFDTHTTEYLKTMEGQKLPVPHCIDGTEGWQLISELRDFVGDNHKFVKRTFGSVELAQHVARHSYDEVELCGLCSDICVVSNALLIKAHASGTRIVVDAQACAGVTEESHKAALLTMKMCHIDIVNE